jgi:hypothetical protein
MLVVLKRLNKENWLRENVFVLEYNIAEEWLLTKPLNLSLKLA